MTKAIDVEIIMVGNELLKGERRDAHLSYIADRLLVHGIRVGAAHVIDDDRVSIGGLVSDRLDNTRVMIVCGGLGPTHDDVTREGVADGLGVALEYHEDEWHVIQKIFATFGREAAESNKRQAYFPEGAQVIPNPKGTAAGFFAEKDGTLLAVLPGPPREVHAMMPALVARVTKLFNRPKLLRATFRTTGIGESAMTKDVQPIFDEVSDVFTVASLPNIGGVDIVITQLPGVDDGERVAEAAATFEKKLRAVLGDRVYEKGERALEEVIGDMLTSRGETLALAESLTGGWLGKRMTDTPGSSAYFLSDVVAYSNAAKVDLVGVKSASLDAHGAVSEVVCREMAAGIRERSGATWALATTGIAGPGGGSDDKPVGLTYYGVAWQGGTDIRHAVFPGDRDTIRQRVNFAALYLLYRELL